jgi:hydrogenase nickel incorporation protein HypA/HybF
MHELAITQSLVKIALSKAEEAGALRIRKINLKIGRLTGYVPEAVEMNFEMMVPGTRAEGAVLDIQWVPIRCRCRDCGAEFRSDQLDLTCPECGQLSGQVIDGREMFIDSIEIDN